MLHFLPPDPKPEPWTPARILMLRKLWDEGPAASKIADQLGGGATRNSVLGMVHRLDLATRTRSGGPRTPATPPAEKPSKAKRAVVTVESIFPPRAAPEVAPEAPASKPCSFADLKSTSCRWPLGEMQDRVEFFCGAYCDVAEPYCLHHAQRSRVKP